MNSKKTAHHQRRWDITVAACPSIYFGQERQLCGIYTLEFSRDDERYVGQTVNLVNRTSSHMRRWDDIFAIGFIECPPEELDTLEGTMITRTQRDHVMRNKMFTSNPAPDADLDLIIDRQEQIEWLHDVAAASPSDRRTIEASRRLARQKSFDQLTATAHYDLLLEDLSQYIHQVIPWPSVTGGTYCSMTAMPGTSRSKDHRRLLTLNAHNVELVRVHEFQDPVEVGIAINMATGHVKGVRRREWEIEQVEYRSYGKCDAIWADLGGVEEVLAVPGVLEGAREMALQLMRKGPSIYARFHSDAMLDAVLAAKAG